jgi:hypothetical protein
MFLEAVGLKMTVACTIGCLKGLIHAQRPTTQVGEWLITLLEILFHEKTLEKVHISANKVVVEGGVGPFYPEKEHDVTNVGIPVFDLVLNYFLMVFSENQQVKWDQFVFTSSIIDLKRLKELKVVQNLARKSFSFAFSTNWPIDEPDEYDQVYKLQAMTLVIFLS